MTFGWKIKTSFSFCIVFTLILILCGCKKETSVTFIYIDIDRSAEASPEWKTTLNIDAHQNSAAAFIHLPTETPAEVHNLNALQFPQRNASVLIKARQDAESAIMEQQKAALEQLKLLAQERVESKKPILRTALNDELNAKIASDRIALSNQLSILNREYAKLRFALELSKNAMDIRKDSLGSLQNIETQDKLIQEKMKQYDQELEIEAQTLRRDARAAIAADRVKIEEKISQESAKELRIEIAAVESNFSKQPKLDLPMLDTPGAKLVPGKTITLSAFNPPNTLPYNSSDLNKNALLLKAEWQQFIKTQTKEAAIDWCKKHGYSLTNNPEKGKDFTDSFIADWVL